MNSKFLPIEKLFGKDCLLDYPCQSRIQPIDYKDAKVFIKRDDELSLGISGSKYRKYLSLIPYIKKNGIEHIVAEGSEYSNNIVGLSQVLNEHGIKYTFILKEGSSDSAVNKKLLKILAPEDSIRLLSRSQWKDRKDHIKTELARHKDLGVSALFLPEGANHISALPGAMTLSYDIDETNYTHIYIDAGTGHSFLGLYFGLSLKGFKGTVVVISLFEDREYFINLIEHYRGLDSNLKDLPQLNFEVIRPEKSRSFGAFNADTKESIKYLASNYGILTDPLYSGKSIMTALIDIEGSDDPDKKSSSLIIHSGGALALSGFLM